MSNQLGVADAHFVTDRIAVGGDLDLYDTDLAVHQAFDLVDRGITHVLDVRLEADDHDVWEHIPEVTYRSNGIDDAGQDVPAWWWEEVVGWALAALDVPGSRLLTHCHMGINRGPSVGYAVLLGLGWDPVEAIDAIRRARPVAHAWYAESALRWHHGRTGAGAAERRRDHERLAAWRRENPLDVVRIIRRVRDAEGT